MSNNTGNTIVALLTGAAIGAGFGLLYAPQSGKETREQLKEEAGKAKDKLSKEYDDLSAQVSDFADSAKSKFEKRVDKLFKSANNQADDILANMESELESLRKKNADLVKELDKLKA
ncbi:YtxH domain-containing protein [Mesohalobacter halotolerans]|jgi:gas vesicle protein|uniref:YtxH domain-containing protein n=1 Tax=Mesohalobacter halotolerans TaxID=1883405 RepID=A0A4U5TU91_9FLAO|nr:YtxH domain-containing protein [Mesohalobacter halotolerans]MBS3738981.1 YtxH domain-containing protein [Psychroflexus sp.]NBC57380.1 YtxH domain-containing protein [Bacteroidota bacterium]TKS57672.1 YtxH domain-containing protein [Mesohalobacter halotolerans]